MLPTHDVCQDSCGFQRARTVKSGNPPQQNPAQSHSNPFLVSLVLIGPTPITRRRRRVPSTMSTSRSSSTRASLVPFVKTHLATLPSQGEQLMTGKGDVYQQPIAGLALLALCCPIGAAARVNVDVRVLSHNAGKVMLMGFFLNDYFAKRFFFPHCPLHRALLPGSAARLGA